MTRFIMRSAPWALAAAAAAGVLYSFGGAARAAVPTLPYEVAATYPHDPLAFTQGLTVADGVLYEGTGLEGASSLRREDLATGGADRAVEYKPPWFGEGVAVAGDRIYQLTWRDGVCFVYDLATFREVARFEYDGEGWGLTCDGEYLIMSDGSSVLTYREPATFAAVKTVTVAAAGKPLENLNELEWVEGMIYANVWPTDRVAIIDPATGAVTAWLDLGRLGPRPRGESNCANGVAYDARAKKLFVTGKRWDKIYELIIEKY